MDRPAQTIHPNAARSDSADSGPSLTPLSASGPRAHSGGNDEAWRGVTVSREYADADLWSLSQPSLRQRTPPIYTPGGHAPDLIASTMRWAAAVAPASSFTFSRYTGPTQR